MRATATEPPTTGRRRPGASQRLRALDNGSAPGANGTRRPPPYDEEAERSLIGAMLIPRQGGTAIEAAVASVVPEDFYVQPHPALVSAVFALAAQGTTVDVVTVADHMRKQGAWSDELAVRLVEMVGEVPTISGAGDYAAIVRSCSRRRQMKAVAVEIDHAAQEGDDEALERALTGAHEVAGAWRPALVYEDLGAVLRGEVPELLPTMLCRSDGQALLYPGLLHWVMGEPGCGKTWLALIAARAVVQAGGSAMYLDYEGSQRIVGSRLAWLGATETETEGIAYTRPSGQSGPTGAAAARDVRDGGHTLVVIDGAAKAMARDGLDEDRASEVLGWLERLVWPLCAAGAAVLVLDHVPKDKDARGRWARGSGAKLGEVDGAAYAVKVGKAWSRHKAGYALVDVAKDREGVIGAQGDTAARLVMRPGLSLLEAELVAPHGDEEGAGITVADVVLAVVSHSVEPLTQSGLEAAVRARGGGFRSVTVRSAAESLASAGRIRVHDGPRNARLYSRIEEPDQGDLGLSQEAF